MVLFNRRINTDSLDRIIMTEKDSLMVNNFLNKHLSKSNPNLKEIEEGAKEIEPSFLQKGLFTFVTMLNGTKAELTHYYNITNDYIIVAEIEENGEMNYKAVFDMTSDFNLKTIEIYSDKYKRLERANLDINEKLKGTSYATFSMILNFIKYSQISYFLKSQNKVVVKRPVIKGTEKKTKKQLQREAREQARRKVSVSQKKRDYDYTTSVREGEKRPYDRKAELWETRGHYRYLKKSGKRVWVKGHKKGEGIRKGKDFTV